VKRDAPLEHLANEDVAPPRGAIRPFQPASLFAEILDWMLAPLLLMVPISIVATYLVASSIANTPFDRTLSERAVSIGQQVHFDAAQPLLSMPQPLQRFLRIDEGEHVFYQVRDSHNLVASGDADLPIPAESDPASIGLVQFRNLSFRGERVRVAYLEVEGADPAHQHALIQLAETLGGRARLANEIIKGVMLPQFVIFPIAVVLVWFGLTRGVRPLGRLQERIAARRPDDLRPIDPYDTPVEMVPLVDSFNQLLARLEANLTEQKRFIADAAHQMRTPLAGLRTQAELALRANNPEDVKRSLQQLLRGSVRATRLVEQLLSLASAETNAHAHANFIILDLEALAREVMRGWVPLALERGIDLGFEGCGEPVLVDAHPVLLRELLKNLVDNALRYTAGGGAVTVRVMKRIGELSAALEVEDNGPGIPTALHGLVFERFYRVLGNTEDGSGLGLAIVREIARQHNASIELRDANGTAPAGARGTVITVSLSRVERPLDNGLRVIPDV
jgi:two-component system sensor histidine kinase TctE